MTYNTIVVEKVDQIGKITLNRPEAYNTFTIPLALELNQALLEMDQNPEIAVVIINGNGKNFCAGIDVKYVDGKSHAEYVDWHGLMGRMNLTMTEMKKPVIASVHNLAVANGVGIVAAADLAIADESARFGATAVNIGLFCMGPAVPLLKNIGRKRTMELILTGDLIDAKTALSWGLINKVVKDDMLEEETMKWAKKLADKSRQAIALGKACFYKTEDLNLKQGLDMADQYFASLCASQDGEEGVRAFLEKREPRYRYPD